MSSDVQVFDGDGSQVEPKHAPLAPPPPSEAEAKLEKALRRIAYNSGWFHDHDVVSLLAKAALHAPQDKVDSLLGDLAQIERPKYRTREEAALMAKPLLLRYPPRTIFLSGLSALVIFGATAALQALPLLEVLQLFALIIAGVCTVAGGIWWLLASS